MGRIALIGIGIVGAVLSGYLVKRGFSFAANPHWPSLQGIQGARS